MRTIIKNSLSVIVIILAVLLCLSACGSPQTAESTEPFDTSTNIPEDPKFSQIQVGMTEEQIRELLGEPINPMIASSYFPFIEYRGVTADYVYHLYPNENNQWVLIRIETIPKQP